MWDELWAGRRPDERISNAPLRDRALAVRGWYYRSAQDSSGRLGLEKERVMHVEFLGIPRERAGIATLELQVETLGQLLATLAIRFPSLGELITADRLASSVVANLNGDRFVSDPDTQLKEEDCVLILSADAGG